MLPCQNCLTRFQRLPAFLLKKSAPEESTVRIRLPIAAVIAAGSLLGSGRTVELSSDISVFTIPGLAELTSTVSVTEPTCRTGFNDATSCGCSSIRCNARWNPGDSIPNSYLPAGSAVNVKRPLASVFALLLALVSVCRKVTVAPEIIAPAGSVTVPFTTDKPPAVALSEPAAAPSITTEGIGGGEVI